MLRDVLSDTFTRYRGADPVLLGLGGGMGGGEVLARLDELARLAAAGRIGQAHRIMVLLPDGAENALIVLGLADLCTCVPVNPALTAAALTAFGLEADIDAVLHDDSTADLARALPFPTLRWARTGAVFGPLPEPRLDGGSASLVLSTSGSTGVPKRVPLRMAQLIGSARTIARTLDLGPADRAVAALPVFHIGAVVDLLLAPLLSGGSVVSAGGRGPGALFEAVMSGGGTWIQLVPTMLAQCLKELTEEDLRRLGQRLDFMRIVSADLAPALQDRAERALGGIPMVAIYGMTETAGQIASNGRHAADRRSGTVGRPAGPEVAVLDPAGQPAARGEICVRGPCVMEGYEGLEPTPRHGDWLRTGDLGYLDTDGFLVLSGRSKDIINRGGEKISPVVIEQAALTIDAVSEAAAFALPHPTLGEQVGLAVVTRSGITEAQILTHLTGHLSEFERPRRIDILPAFPRLGSGKIDKTALVAGMQTAAGAAAGPGRGEASATVTATHRIVADLWQSTLGAGRPRADDDFFDAGGDSLSATEFVVALERALGRPVSANLLFETPRFDALVAALGAAERQDGPRRAAYEAFLMTQTSQWSGSRAGPRGLIVRHDNDGPGHPVFLCLNNTRLARIFPAGLGDNHPFYLLRSLHGIPKGRDKLTRRLAVVYAQEIDALQPSGPLVLGGSCYGGHTMALVARELMRRGREIRLFLSADYMFESPPDFPVVGIYSDTVAFSPFGRFRNPRRAFADLYPLGIEAFHLPGTHLQTITVAALRGISDTVLPLINGAARIATSPPAAPNLATRARSWRARITAAPPHRMAPNETITLAVRVTNTSRATWAAGADGGMMLSAAFTDKPPKWYSLDRSWFKRLVGPMVWGAPPVVPLHPGRTFEQDLHLTAPSKPGDYLLRVAMVDDGYRFFGPAPWGARRFRVIVVPPPDGRATTRQSG